MTSLEDSPEIEILVSNVKTNKLVQTTQTVRANDESLLKIMPLGDSLTLGVQGTGNRDSAGYRTELWKKLVAQGLKVEFVGSQCHGPAHLNDKAHEGHPGWTIKQIEEGVQIWLNTYQPDLILLMIGTNDTRKSSVGTMIVQLSQLIDRIITCSLRAQLLVASIPPIHPSKQTVRRIVHTMTFNRAIPWLINFKAAQGKKVTFVDMTSLTINDLTSSLPLELDNGIHLHADGYRKMAHVWYEAILKVIKKRRLFADRFSSPAKTLNPATTLYQRWRSLHKIQSPPERGQPQVGFTPPLLKRHAH